MVWLATSRVPILIHPMEIAITSRAKSHEAQTLLRRVVYALCSMASTLRSSSITMS